MEIIKGRFSPEYWYGLKLTIALISLFLSLFVFSVVSYDFSNIGFLYYSDHLVHLIVGEVVTPSITIMMKGITFLGSNNFIWGITALIFILCPLLILLIGLSRIYLGVHWLTDVIGGYCAGYSWLLINILVVRIIKDLTLLLPPWA
jgi:membrane-associated phospholipid phosphatase